MANIGGLLSYVIFSLGVPLLFAISFVVMVWGSLLYFISGTADEEMREKGKSLILYGLLVFGAMTLIWGLIRIIMSHV